MRHQHQRGRRLERGGADIGRNPREDLPQPRIGKMLPQRVPQRAEWGRTEQPPQPRLPGEAERARPRRAEEGGVQRVMDAPRPFAKGAIAAQRRAAGEGADRVCRLLRIDRQVESRPVAPGMAAQQRFGPQGHARPQAVARRREDFLEQRTERQQGRARAEAHAIDRDIAHLAARPLGLVEHDHRAPPRSEQRRRHEAAHPGPDHRHGVAACRHGRTQSGRPGCVKSA